MIGSRANLTDTVGGEGLIASLKSAPPVAVSALSVAGVSLQDWVLIATFAYIVLQAAHLAWKWYRDSRVPRDG